MIAYLCIGVKNNELQLFFFLSSQLMSALSRFVLSNSPAAPRIAEQVTPTRRHSLETPETPPHPTPTRLTTTPSSLAWEYEAEQRPRPDGCEDNIFNGPRHLNEATPRTAKRRKTYARNISRSFGLSECALDDFSVVCYYHSGLIYYNLCHFRRLI